jgi:hypothetical protein
LDRRRAIEWQRSQIQNKAPSDNGDKKKRPASKSHKKKTKPSDLQVNGYHDHDGHRNGSPQDYHPHTKKTKGHRSTQSVSSQIKRSPPYNPRQNSHAHPPSPAHTPPDLPKDFEVHTFSETFQHLYDDDQSFKRTESNSFAGLEFVTTLSQWLDNPEKLSRDAGVEDEKDAFQRITVDPKNLHWPDLRVDRREVVMNNDISRRFCSLVIQTSLKDSCAIGQLTGSVGFQKDYCNDPSNRWQEFVHPKPFVFFPPHLPIYIDARYEGSDCRYTRRSCRPNANVETIIAHGRDYNFWLVSDRQISNGEQITLPWDFRFPPQRRSRFLHLLNLGDPDGVPFDGSDITDEEYEQLTNVTHTVLSEYGGCACELGNDCAFARFHRNYHGRLHNQSNGMKSKKGRRSKQNHVSPTSTGHATNSRAASEGQQDQYDEDDSRSVSGSVRSKPQSRDLTPIHDVGANGILTEPTDREKRKLQALEDSFRKMEQGQPSRKKKRTSEGSAMSAPASSTTPQPQSRPRQKSVAPRVPISQLANTNGSRTNRYVDASTSRRESGSPFNAGSPTGLVPSPGNSGSRSGSMAYRSRQASMAPKSSYTNASTQTDEVENAWYSCPSATPPPKRSIIPLSKRLLKNRLKLQSQIEARRASGGEEQNVLGSPTVLMDLDGPGHEERCNAESPTDSRGCNASIASSISSVDITASTMDVNMTDAPAIMVGSTIKPPPPPWPGQSNAPRSNSILGQKSPELRVQMPPAPTFSIPSMSGTPSGNVTPSSAAGSIAQSPFGTAFPPFPPPVVNGAVQSPAKGPKKLSLSDYKDRLARAKKEKDESARKPSEGSSPTVPPAVLKPSLSTVEEAKVAGILEGSAIVDTPFAEKTLDPLSLNADPSSDPAPKNSLPPSEISNGTL